MKLLYGALFLIGVITLNHASSPVALKRIATDKLLMKQLMDSRAADNPSVTMECFNLYIPIFNEILDEFSKSYELCVSEADELRNELAAEAAANRTVIIAEAQAVCGVMNECSALEDVLPFFDCYSRVGDENIKSVYSLTNEAADDAENLREQYALVDNNMYKCENASERAFVEDTAKTEEALNTCLVNGPPEVVTTTVAAEPTTTPEAETTPVAEDAFDEEYLEGNSPIAPMLKLNKYQRNSKRLGH